MPHIRWRSFLCRTLHFKHWKVYDGGLICCGKCKLWQSIQEGGKIRYSRLTFEKPNNL